MKTYSIGIIALIMLAAGGSAQASIYKNFGKWSVLCSGNLNCKIRATIGSKSAQITTLTFDRDAGPATPLTLILGTPRQTLPDAARKPTIAFSIDGAGPARMSQDALSFDRATNSWKLKDTC